MPGRPVLGNRGVEEVAVDVGVGVEEVEVGEKGWVGQDFGQVGPVGVAAVGQAQGPADRVL